MKVLVIDDHDALRDALRDVLKCEGFHVRDAGLGLDGAHLAWKHRPDVIVLDVNLPDISGWEVMRHIRSREGFGNIPILFFSGSVAEQRRYAVEKQHNTRFLLKPAASDMLVRSIRNLVNGARQSRTCIM